MQKSLLLINQNVPGLHNILLIYLYIDNIQHIMSSFYRLSYVFKFGDTGWALYQNIAMIY